MTKILAILFFILLIWIALKVTKFLLRLVLIVIAIAVLAAAYFAYMR
jgi:hypothetical protein